MSGSWCRCNTLNVILLVHVYSLVILLLWFLRRWLCTSIILLTFSSSETVTSRSSGPVNTQISIYLRVGSTLHGSVHIYTNEYTIHVHVSVGSTNVSAYTKAYPE